MNNNPIIANSMEQNPWEAKRPSSSQQFPRIFQARRFITAFTRAHHHPISWARAIQCTLFLPTSWPACVVPEVQPIYEKLNSLPCSHKSTSVHQSN
jgi:hypothetical protein